jgi:hypothetical protein
LNEIDYPLENINIFRISNSLYDNLYTSSSDLLLNIIYNEAITSLSKDELLIESLTEILKYIKLNKDIQSSLMILAQVSDQYNDYIKALIDHYLLLYQINNLEENNILFNHYLFTKINSLFKIHHFNEGMLMEYYILNDYDYLNNTSEYNIKLHLIYNLVKFKNSIDGVIKDLKLEISNINREEFRSLYNLYKSFGENYINFFKSLDKLTLSIFKDRFNNGYILPNEIIKSRQLEYFKILFNREVFILCINYNFLNPS